MFLSGMLARGRTRVKAGEARAALRWAPALAWMTWIGYLSHQSKPLAGATGDADLSPGHVLLFGVLALLLFWALAGPARERGGPVWLVAGVAFAVTVLYGVADEVHQAFVAGRTASEGDLALDAFGALLAVLVATGLPALLRAGRGRHP